MSDDQDQKTEQATGKKLSQARSSGNLPISREVGSWFLFVGILISLSVVVPLIGTTLINRLRVFFEMAHQLQIGDSGMQRLLAETLLNIALPILLLFLILLFFSFAGTIAQTGFYASMEILKFKPGQLNPLKGWQRLFSAQSLVELVKSIIKMFIIGLVAYNALYPIITQVEENIGKEINTMMSFMHETAIKLMLKIMVIVTIIAVGDWFYRRFAYFKSLRMTKQEVKDERKQSEGDPMIKMRMRRLRAQKARKRMMAAVPNATVVITNPTHYAVAMQYDSTKNMAPIVVAKGTDLVALRIREVAEEHDVPLLSNPPLARALYQAVEIDQEIPPEHYRAVAEIISFVFKLKTKPIKTIKR